MTTLYMLFLAAIVCHMTMINQSEAMHGLCSTNWMADASCFDVNDECKHLGGECFHDGQGDHGEGCVCKKKVKQGSNRRWETLVKHHLPLAADKQKKKEKTTKYN